MTGQIHSPTNEDTDTQKKIFKILFKEDDVTWKSIILDLIKTENMDPWDIDVGRLSEDFIKTLQTMKQFDFRVSGKIVLAASFFLKIKSDKLVNEDLAFLDDLISPNEESDILDMADDFQQDFEIENPGIKVRTPRPRKRKVSVYDLMGALENALESGAKKYSRNAKKPKKMKVPEKQKDITLIISDLFEQIQQTLKKVSKITFKSLIDSENKAAKVNTFIPLLYLDAQEKINLTQNEHFGDIHIELSGIKEDYKAANSESND